MIFEADEFLLRLEDACLSVNIPEEVQNFLKNNISKMYCDYDFEDPFDIQIFRNKIYEVTNLIEQNQGAENPLTPKLMKRILLILATKH